MNVWILMLYSLRGTDPHSGYVVLPIPDSTLGESQLDFNHSPSWIIADILKREFEIHEVIEGLLPSRNSIRISISLAGASSFRTTDPKKPIRATP